MEADQDSIHEAGKGGRCVAQAKGDLVELKQLSAAGSKRGLSFVLFRDRHLPVSTFNAQSREPFSPMESIQEVIIPGQGVSILDGSCIELTEVHTKTQTTVFLPHHHHWRGPWAVRGSNDIARQHLLNLRHFFPANCGVLPPVRLADRWPMGLNPMLQQGSITQVVVTLTEDVLELLKQLIELLLLERGEALWEGWLARFLWRMRGGRGRGWCFREVDHLEDAYTLPCVKQKGLRLVIVHGIPELWTTWERRNAGHKSRESTIRAKKDVLSGPWVVTTDKAGCLGRNVCCLKQPSTASRVRVGQVRWCKRVWWVWTGFSRGWRKICRQGKSCTPILGQRIFLPLGRRRGRYSCSGGRERGSWRRVFLEQGRRASCLCGGPFLWLLAPSGIKVDGLGIRLRRSFRPIRHINVDPQRPHYIHPNQTGRWLKSHNDYEASPTPCLAPLDVQMCRPSCYI